MMERECETQDVLSGRKAVRVNFIQRVQAAGLVRAKACKTEADHDSMIRRLVEYLAYLSPASIETLADQVLDLASGPKRNQWPTELCIRQMADALERRPFAEMPIVKSWLASVEGPQAERGGYLVELFRHLRRNPRPITSYDLQMIRTQAAENRRTQVLIDERRRHGIDRTEDDDWVSAYCQDQERARAIVASGDHKRADKAEGHAA